MASSSLSTTASASLLSKTTSTFPHSLNYTLPRVSFPLSPPSNLRFFTKGLQPPRYCSTLVKAQSNEVTVDGSSNAAAASPPTKEEEEEEVSSPETQVPKPSNAALASEESISEFISQVANLVKLVDSRDIVELQLKQLDCELLIRKKEALSQPPSLAPAVMTHPSSAPPPPAVAPSSSAVAPTTASTLLPAAPRPSNSPSPKSGSSLPPFKSPMAGTFYKASAPGEPPFVKVGDKVQKGQVLCIVEAMKLMNEIEADRSGTIVEILAEDGKPVSVDTPLCVIKP